MNDLDYLVDELRCYRVSAPPEHPLHPAVCERAADAIERLRVELSNTTGLRDYWRQRAEKAETELRCDYALLEELSPPDVPRAEYRADACKTKQKEGK